MLTRLIYFSENHLGAACGTMIHDLNGIMDIAIRNNKKVGITGILLFDLLWFVQILEGECQAVGKLLRRLMRDVRHNNLVVMDCRTIEERHFGNWWMGLALLQGEKGPLISRHGMGDSFDPRNTTGEQILDLAIDLAGSGLDRRLAPQAA